MPADQKSPDLEHAPGRNRLAGKVVLVIGGGSIGPGWGNGKAAAVVYAREGAKVAVSIGEKPRRRKPSISSARQAAKRPRCRAT